MPVPTPQPSESRWVDDLSRLLRQSVGKPGQGLPSSANTGKFQNTKYVDPIKYFAYPENLHQHCQKLRFWLKSIADFVVQLDLLTLNNFWRNQTHWWSSPNAWKIIVSVSGRFVVWIDAESKPLKMSTTKYR